jgi:mannose-6-phosphate isomerase-like protein (cupin superfamily)
MKKHDTIDIGRGTWHRVHNYDTQPLKLDECVESDIERDNGRVCRD